MCVDGVYSGEESLKQLNTVICEHLFRQGKLEIGERVMKVSVLVMHGTLLTAIWLDGHLNRIVFYREVFRGKVQY
jgi:hypothetical protein